MPNLTQKAISKKNRDRRDFTLDHKKQLCAQWRASGLNRYQFCKQNDLVLSAFSKWCDQIKPEDNNAGLDNDWLPLIGQSDAQSEEEVSVKIMLPTQMAVHVPLKLSSLKTLLQELCHATTVIR